MRSRAAVAVIAILVVASLGAGYLAESGVRQTETRTLTSTTRTGQPIQAADIVAANISLAEVGDIVFDANGSRAYLLQGIVPYSTYSQNYSLTVIDTSSNAVVANVSLPPIGFNGKEGASAPAWPSTTRRAWSTQSSPGPASRLAESWRSTSPRMLSRERSL